MQSGRRRVGRGRRIGRPGRRRPWRRAPPRTRRTAPAGPRSGPGPPGRARRARTADVRKSFAAARTSPRRSRGTASATPASRKSAMPSTALSPSLFMSRLPSLPAVRGRFSPPATRWRGPSAAGWDAGPAPPSRCSDQICAAIKRVYVHGDLYDPLVALPHLARTTPVGDPLAAGTALEPMSKQHAARPRRRGGRAARESGATTIVTGVTGSTVPAPTTPGDRHRRRRRRRHRRRGAVRPGPAGAALDDLDAAIAAANGTDYGLGASGWGRTLPWPPASPAGSTPARSGSTATASFCLTSPLAAPNRAPRPCQRRRRCRLLQRAHHHQCRPQPSQAHRQSHRLSSPVALPA